MTQDFCLGVVSWVGGLFRMRRSSQAVSAWRQSGQPPICRLGDPPEDFGVLAQGVEAFTAEVENHVRLRGPTPFP